MNLTPEQSNTIRHWGEKTQHVNEIRLFGSRARGDGAEKSDIDLAVTSAVTIPTRCSVSITLEVKSGRRN